VFREFPLHGRLQIQQRDQASPSVNRRVVTSGRPSPIEHRPVEHRHCLLFAGPLSRFCRARRPPHEIASSIPALSWRDIHSVRCRRAGICPRPAFCASPRDQRSDRPRAAAQPESNIIARPAQNQEHMQQWMDHHSNLSLPDSSAHSRTIPAFASFLGNSSSTSSTSWPGSTTWTRKPAQPHARTATRPWSASRCPSVAVPRFRAAVERGSPASPPRHRSAPSSTSARCPPISASRPSTPPPSAPSSPIRALHALHHPHGRALHPSRPQPRPLNLNPSP